MLRRSVVLLAILALTLCQASAKIIINPYVFGAAVALYRATCVTDGTNLTTYTFSNITITGVDDTDSVVVVVGIVGEDSDPTFGVSSATVEGGAATELVDEGGAGGGANGAIYRSDTITNAAIVDITVTWSEALTSSTVCVWALENLSSSTPTATAADSDGTGADIILTLDPTTAGGFAVGVCIDRVNTVGWAWDVLAEVEDADSGEHRYTNADAATTGASMAVTCNSTGTSNASGAAAAFR